MGNVNNNTLQIAINNAAVDEVITLTEDITITSRITVANIITLDLNGYTISGDINDGYGAIYVGTKGVLTIQDSSLEKAGKIINTIGNAIGNYGEVKIYNGTFVGNYALYNFYYNNTTYGTSIIYGGTFKSVDGSSPSVANCGDLTISGGIIEKLDTTSVLKITGGKVEYLLIGIADYNPPTQSTSINGGYVAELSVADNSTNNIVVSGGTFGCKIDSQYLANKVTLTYDATTGTYKAAVGEYLKVIATNSDRLRDLVIQNGQLIFIQDLGRIALDFKNKRKFYHQIEELDTEISRQELESPINGAFYFVIETAVLWNYRNNEWIQITGTPDEVVFIGVEFPALGQKQTIYANTTDGNEHIAVWDDTASDYHVVADKTYSVTSEEVRAMFN